MMFGGSFTLQLFLLSYLTFIPFLISPVIGVWPAVGRHGFSVVWNMPTSRCQRLYGVSLPLEEYGIIHNAGQRFQGENISLFYKRRLGLYPYINHQGLRVSGGIPQLGDLQDHLYVIKSQLSILMRKSFSGLAVLDWEAWMPLWSRNYGVRKVYKRLSKDLVRQKNPDMSEKDVTTLATAEFEKAARAFMEKTLSKVVKLRPRGLWGFYGFPSCYNDKNADDSGYTGQCKPETKILNDRLTWLWQRSTALYPSVYVLRRLAGQPNTRLMVRHRVLEALRVGSQPESDSRSLPVLPYARVAFTHTLQFLNKTDLQHTLGESAALGAAGVVLWGELSFAKSRKQCVLLHDYISSVLGVYVDALRRGVTRCSESLCRGNGRCARRNPHSDHMIPLSAPGSKPDHDLRSKFKCVCYEGFSGEQCENAKDLSKGFCC